MSFGESDHVALMECHVCFKNDETNRQIKATDLQLCGILFGNTLVALTLCTSKLTGACPAYVRLFLRSIGMVTATTHSGDESRKKHSNSILNAYDMEL